MTKIISSSFSVSSRAGAWVFVSLCLLALLPSLSLAANPWRDAISRRDAVVLGHAPATPQGRTKSCADSMRLAPKVKAECHTFLACKHALTVTQTRVVTKTKTLHTHTTTITPTTVTAPVTETSFVYTSTTTVLVAPTTTPPPPPRRRLASLDGGGAAAAAAAAARAADSLVARNSCTKFKEWQFLERFLDVFGSEITTEACLYLIYGNSPVPTKVNTVTHTVTSTPSVFTQIMTATATETETQTISTVSTQAAAQATGKLLLPSGFATRFATAYYDPNYGSHLATNGVGVTAIIIYDVATGNLIDFTRGTKTDILGSYIKPASDTESYLFIGSIDANNPPLLLTCSIQPIIDGQPLQCFFPNDQTPSSFADKNGQTAMYFDYTTPFQGDNAFQIVPLVFEVDSLS